eukprot:scaffold17516_cov134-Isochrysis_galbana.AAC.5
MRYRGDGRDEIAQRRGGRAVDGHDDGAFLQPRLVPYVARVSDVHAAHWHAIIPRLLVAELVERGAAHLRHRVGRQSWRQSLGATGISACACSQRPGAPPHNPTE